MNLLEGFDKTEGVVGYCLEKTALVTYFKDRPAISSPLQFFSLAQHSGLHSAVIPLKGGLAFKYAYIFNNLGVWKKFTQNNRDSTKTYNDPIQNLLVGRGARLYKGLLLKDLTTHAWDIETTGLDRFAPDAKVLLISNTVEKGGVRTNKLFSIDEYEHEGKMLDAWCAWIQEIDPDIQVTYNGYAFDIPYVVARANQFGTRLRMGRDNRLLEIDSYGRKFRLDAGRFLEFNMPNVPGRECIDMMLVAFKWDIGKMFSSYGLKNVAKQLGVERQKATYYDASKIRTNWKIPGEMQKIKDYAIDDADETLGVFNRLIGAYFAATQLYPMTLQQITTTASGGQIDALMVSSYLGQGHSIPLPSKKVKYQGAISDGYPGIYKNVLKIDINSMYPSVIIEYNVHDPQKDPLELVPLFTRTFREERLKYKKLYKDTGEERYNQLDMIHKVSLNSMYGFFGTEGLCFNAPQCAAFITKKGREILNQSIVWATGSEYKPSKEEKPSA